MIELCDECLNVCYLTFNARNAIAIKHKLSSSGFKYYVNGRIE